MSQNCTRIVSRTYVHSSTSGAADYPPDVAAGDVLLLLSTGGHLFGLGSFGAPPAGWTEVVSRNIGFAGFALCFRVADGSETGSVIQSSSHTEKIGLMLRVKATGAPYGGDGNGMLPMADLTPWTPSVVATAPALLVVFVGGVRNGVSNTDEMCHLPGSPDTGGSIRLPTVDVWAECRQIAGVIGERNFIKTPGEFGGDWNYIASVLVPTRDACPSIVPPLRQRQRDDNRVRARGSQQLSPRAGWRNAYL